MIKIQSFIYDKNVLTPIQIEMTLWPGLPGVQFVGLPDQHLKESATRIKSAIKAQGFTFPRAKQILVNLRPSYLKKNSRGVELAVAVAYLWVSGQVPQPIVNSDFFVYGELGLGGEVYRPEEMGPALKHFTGVVLTGKLSPGEKAYFHQLTIGSLKELGSPQREIIEPREFQNGIRPTNFFNARFDAAAARQMAIVCSGEHSILLAGPSGSGKTFWAEAMHTLLRDPTSEQFQEIQWIHLKLGRELHWRPLVQPHHTTPIAAMVGGGAQISSGEITRAHGGVLLLDEFLEFSPRVIESLREPMSEGKIRVARGNRFEILPAQSLVVATTNLCPCGEWTPQNNKFKPRCRFTLKRCRSYAERFSGPLVDRFEMVLFTQRTNERVISAETIFEQSQKAIEFALQSRNQRLPNSQTSIERILSTFEPLCKKELIPQIPMSERRKMATLRVARTIADLDGSKQVDRHHLSEALINTFFNFQKLNNEWD